jgi:hypothetical protein
LSKAGQNHRELREPVIGDDLDLATYGLPTQQRESSQREITVSRRSAPRSHVAPGAARARRVESHRPRVSDEFAARERRERTSFDAEGVKTVRISGQTTPPRRRSAQREIAFQLDRYDRRPDRAAQWALFMGVFMIVVAIVTGT